MKTSGVGCEPKFGLLVFWDTLIYMVIHVIHMIIHITIVFAPRLIIYGHSMGTGIASHATAICQAEGHRVTLIILWF